MMMSILFTLSIVLANSLAAAPKSQSISEQQAIAVVKESFGGKVLKVNFIANPNASFYKVKLLTKQGRVKQVRVDSHTGEIINNRGSK